MAPEQQISWSGNSFTEAFKSDSWSYSASGTVSARGDMVLQLTCRSEILGTGEKWIDEMTLQNVPFYGNTNLGLTFAVGQAYSGGDAAATVVSAKVTRGANVYTPQRIDAVLVVFSIPPP